MYNIMVIFVNNIYYAVSGNHIVCYTHTYFNSYIKCIYVYIYILRILDVETDLFFFFFTRHNNIGTTHYKIIIVTI